MSYYDNNNNNNGGGGGGGNYQGGEQEDQERGLGSFFGGRKNENAQHGNQGQYSQYPSGPQGPSQSHYGQSFNQAGPRPGGNMAGGNMVGGSAYGGNMPGGDYSQDEFGKHQRNEKYKDWGKTAGMAALGAAAIGAAAYGVHEYRENKEEEEKREEEEKHRREEEERRRHEEEKRRHEQQQGSYGGGWTSPGQDSGYNQHYQSPPPAQYGGQGGFQPPVPMGRPPYSFDQNDVRNADPSRSSENSPTPRQYPQLRHNDGDTVLKIGSIIALKHNMTGRFLHSDRSHGTQTGSNQQLVFGYHWNPDSNDWWQVLPANHDVPVPGSVVSYGTQIRLRHVETGRHLHSHYNFHDKSGQNEVTGYGDESFSDENDHWIIERWGDGGYGSTWSAQDVVVLRHYVSGMTLHSHEILLSEDVQSVTCFGPGREENDKWRVHLN
ncbi:hypothetical protein GGI25_001708 [Coemansia spiralis]|uniref:MIR domain-containing protein n=2 Tax=Coemansia TaxID=4863 RepID=A0A9W8G992_9FUNG|nr:hypothetical protein EDC05_003460 [Coemansia umbellata]KAJ2624952.1 hypothetical protein GGI26_001064 [Coemansia sp. RSA 1358]KAJ2679140.1 hypothetical protein GGI25_001708 [Coemansia spiralis]